jgi:excisionase family DNA binding protein
MRRSNQKPENNLSSTTLATVRASSQGTPPSRLLCADELAEILLCSLSHIYELAARGDIPSLKIGRLIRFELDAVMEAIRNDGVGR